MNETFEQVLGYMTAHESGDAEEAFFDREAWRKLIVRLRAAHECEVETLKAALKPVLECREEACRAFGDHYLMLDNAVREAQRIYKDGESASDAKGDFQENLERKGGE